MTELPKPYYHDPVAGITIYHGIDLLVCSVVDYGHEAGTKARIQTVGSTHCKTISLGCCSPRMEGSRCH